MWNQYLTQSNGNGILTDRYLTDIVRAKIDGVDTLFIYLHGWQTSAGDTISATNRIQSGLSKRSSAESVLAYSVHWPSLADEDGGALDSLLEPLTFYTMKQRAVVVGSHAVNALIRLLIETYPTVKRICIVGHSFGCRVALSAIESLPKLPQGVDLALIQAATDACDLESTGSFPTVLGKVNRMLITTSGQDSALWTYLPIAETIDIFHREATVEALGAVGPTDKTYLESGVGLGVVRFTLEVGPGFSRTAVPPGQRLIVADIGPAQVAQPLPPSEAGLGGQHANYLIDPVMELLAGFFYGA